MRPRRIHRSRDRLESRPDDQLLSLVREGRIDAFRTLYRRHYPAAYGYAAQCVVRPTDAHQLVCRAFTQVLRTTVDGTTKVLGQRHRGCLRLGLLAAVRHTAVPLSAQESGMCLTPRFRRWVANGCQWPLNDGRSLLAPFVSLTESEQCLLWHSVVEQDDPVLVARITGLSPNRLAPMTAEATDRLREAVADAYVGRLREECRETFGRLQAAARPNGHRALRGIAAHLRSCPECLAVYTEMHQLASRLQRQLPPLLLGWWPEGAYRAAKASTTLPECQPRSIERMLFGRDTRSSTPEPVPDLLHDPDSGFGRPEMPAERGGRRTWHRPTRPGGAPAPGRRNPLLRAGGLGAAGLAAVMVALVSLPRAEPAAPGIRLVPADGYAVQAYTEPGSGEHTRARVLGPSSWLRYDRLDFTGAAATRLTAGISAAGGHGVLEVRLDSLAAPPLTELAAPADGSLSEVSVPIPAIKGVHSVFLTARCPPMAPSCIEVLWFGAGRWAAGP
ncbi:carbohydrate-binding protein [Wenjunlia tyrosinilytica]|nr:carbohydrate-binding protein [Wenjunlia tyrosinilytica]